MHELAESIRAKVAAAEPLEPRPSRQAVSLDDITRDAVLKAMDDYDALGQSEFLDIYGFRPARSYVLIHNGKRNDSKAIVGVAHGYLPDKEVLIRSEFSGDEATVGRLLRRLGRCGDLKPRGGSFPRSSGGRRHPPCLEYPQAWAAHTPPRAAIRTTRTWKEIFGGVGHPACGRCRKTSGALWKPQGALVAYESLVAVSPKLWLHAHLQYPF